MNTMNRIPKLRRTIAHAKPVDSYKVVGIRGSLVFEKLMRSSRTKSMTTKRWWNVFRVIWDRTDIKQEGNITGNQKRVTVSVR